MRGPATRPVAVTATAPAMIRGTTLRAGTWRRTTTASANTSHAPAYPVRKRAPRDSPWSSAASAAVRAVSSSTSEAVVTARRGRVMVAASQPPGPAGG